MPWSNTPDKRARDARTYGTPEYKRNRELARKRAGGRCEQCQHRHTRLECDHVIPKSQGGGNELANLKMLCAGEGSCKCHEQKTYAQRGRPQGRSAADPPCTPRTHW